MGTWWGDLIGLDDNSKSSREAQERTEDSRKDRGEENLGRTPSDSDNSDPKDSCGDGDGGEDQK